VLGGVGTEKPSFAYTPLVTTLRRATVSLAGH